MVADRKRISRIALPTFVAVCWLTCPTHAQESPIESKALKTWRKQVLVRIAAVPSFIAAQTASSAPQQLLAAFVVTGAEESTLTLGPTVELKMDKTGRVTSPNGQVLTDAMETRAFLNQAFGDQASQVKRGNVYAITPVLVLRADRNARYRDVFDFIQIASQAGFLMWQVHVTKSD